MVYIYLKLELTDMSLVFVLEDFDWCSDEIDVIEFIIVSIHNSTLDYTI